MSEQQRQAAIARFLAEHFDEAERIRVDALDRMAAEAPARD
jgi:lipase chaperone LimK